MQAYQQQAPFPCAAVQALEFLYSARCPAAPHPGNFINNEYIDVYLVTVKDRIPEDAFTLQKEEVEAVR